MCAELFIDSTLINTNLNVFSGRGFNFDFKKLSALVREIGAEVVVLDPFYKIFDGDESSVEDIKKVLKALDLLSQATQTVVIFVHHDKKGQVSELRASDRGAGSGIMGRDLDTSIVLTPQAADENSVVIEFLSRNYKPRPPMCVEFKNGIFCVSDALPIKESARTLNKRKPVDLGRLGNKAIEIIKENGGGIYLEELKLHLKNAGGTKEEVSVAINKIIEAGQVREEWTKGVKGGQKKRLFLIEAVENGVFSPKPEEEDELF
jgi:hypothetical protein